MGVVTLGDSDDVDDSDDREKTKNPRRAVGRDTPHLSPAGGRVIARTVRDVRDANKDEFKEMYKNKISAGVDKCAEKDDEESKEKCVEKFNKRLDRVDKLNDHARERLQKIEERRLEKDEKFEEDRKKPAFVKFKKDHKFKARVVTKIKVDKARENFLKAKERFEAAKEKYKGAKEKFKERKEKVSDCGDDEGEECEEAREGIKADAKEHLIHVADMILEHLEKVKERVSGNEDLSEEESAEILADLEEKVGKIQEARAAVEAAESKEEIQEAAKVLKRAWTKIKNKIKVHAKRVVNSRIGGIIVKSKQLEVKLEKILERMTENDIDVSSVEGLVDDFNSLLEEAKVKYEEAVEKFEEAKSSDEPDAEMIKSGQESMKAAHEKLQEAQKVLRDILKEIKDKGGEEELEDTEIDEVEEEVEEEDAAEVEE
jgi:hypothetical protein